MPLKILGSRIDAVSFQDALDRIRALLPLNSPHHIITGNTLMLLEAEKDPALREVLENAELVTPESSGILWASRMLGQPLKEFTPGIDLMLAICRMAAEKAAFRLSFGIGARRCGKRGRRAARTFSKTECHWNASWLFSKSRRILP